VILESTVPVHTTRDFVVPKLRSIGVDCGSALFAYAAERIASGRMLEEIRRNDRILGGITPEAAEAARDIYKSFVDGEIFLTDTCTAELVKLAENTYRDINIGFANEVALYCDKEGIDAWEAIELANRHPRVNIHRPGPGVGGHCIPVVPHYLAQGNDHDTLLQAARRINREMPRQVRNEIMRSMAGIDQPKVVLMGLSFKPDSSDPINSPGLQLLDLVTRNDHDPDIDHGRKKMLDLVICDPLIREPPPGLDLVTLEQALKPDCIVFLMAHGQFKELKPHSPIRNQGTVIDFTGLSKSRTNPSAHSGLPSHCASADPLPC